jgi:uncharacterized protein YoxC
MSIGKKILSAFVELDEDKKEENNQAPAAAARVTSSEGSQKFKAYFEKLFNESNLPGPDYFEFSKMVEAMSAIPDEKTRFATAYAGLSIQGLDKSKLIDTAGKYIEILEQDAKQFHATVDKALEDKVTAKKKEMDDKAKRIQDLTREINDLNNRIQILNNEIRENEEKINSNTGSYGVESQNMKARISRDIDKIKQYIS